jgi:parallel beta-helix repeat protein
MKGLTRLGFVAVMALIGALGFSAVPASASHVQCGDTITQDTTLDSDLIDCPGDGLVIASDGVALDLGAHTIDGTRAGEGVDNGGGFDGLRVFDGKVKEFERGVLAAHAAHISVRRLEVTANGSTGIELDHTTDSLVKDSAATGSGRYGVQLEAGVHNRLVGVTASDNGLYGMRLFSNCDRNTISRSIADRNSSTGISVDRCTKTFVRRNHVADNSGLQQIDVEHATETFVLENHVAADPAGISNGIVILGADNVVSDNTIRAGSRSAGIAVSIGDGNQVSSNDILIAGRGIDIGSDRNTVRGNKIANSTITGIELFESSLNVLSRNAITSGAGIGIFLRSGLFDEGSQGNQIKRNLIESNSYGIVLQGPAHDTVIADNIADDNRGDGILVDDRSDRVRIDRNSVARNQYGIHVHLGPGSRVHSNRVTASANTGISITSLTDGSIVGNVALGNSYGILCFGCSRDRIANNTASNNTLLGGSFNDSSNSVIEHFVAEHNGLEGIDLNRSTDNVLRESRALDNGADGILVRGPGPYLIERNEAHRNADDGIDVETSSSTLTGNTANENTSLGIEAVQGVTDGGGNRAAQNGNPAQCLNVFCK